MTSTSLGAYVDRHTWRPGQGSKIASILFFVPLERDFTRPIVFCVLTIAAEISFPVAHRGDHLTATTGKYLGGGVRRNLQRHDQPGRAVDRVSRFLLHVGACGRHAPDMKVARDTTRSLSYFFCESCPTFMSQIIMFPSAK